MNNPKDKIIQEFLRMGISAQEVRAYISLLEQGYVTGYQLSKSAGIPSSKIYSVLNRMLDRGFVLAANTRPVRYVPKPPEELLAGIRDDFRASLDALENSLKSIRNGTGRNDNVAWNTTGRADVMRKARSMIDRSTERIYLAVWPQDLRPIRASLSEAVKRRVQLHHVSYGKTTFDRGTIYYHRPSDYPFRERRERRFVLISDSSKAVIASFGPEGDGNGIWTENPGLVNLFKDFVIHEIYIVKIEEAFPKEIRAAYGRDWERIRMV
jgi:sugar-specific transcriptional regulator TrmB